MSALTKILIVLLTISSIFLCGIVVTYVASADNYRQKYDDLRDERDSLSKKVKSLTEMVNDKIAEGQQLEEELRTEIASLTAEIDELELKLNDAEREKATLLQKVNSWTSITKDFYKTNEEQGKLLDGTLSELKKVKAEQIKQSKELNETTSVLVEKMAVIETLEAEKKRLLEEKSELRSRLDQLLLPTGETVTDLVPVTPERTKAKPVELVRPGTEDIDLKGQVSTVDLKNSFAEISIGRADGVTEGMKFHVTRGDEFICDILIIDVESEKAVGVLELLKPEKAPRAGDKVSTNL